jgi:acyl-CoA hydrolase
MDKATAFAASRRARSTVVTASIDGIEVNVPIMKRDITKLVVGVKQVGRTSKSPGGGWRFTGKTAMGGS